LNIANFTHHNQEQLHPQPPSLNNLVFSSARLARALMILEVLPVHAAITVHSKFALQNIHIFLLLQRKCIVYMFPCHNLVMAIDNVYNAIVVGFEYDIWKIV
jgi:hypothetical protein